MSRSIPDESSPPNNSLKLTRRAGPPEMLVWPATVS